MAVSEQYCSQCGYPNASTRGACLICYSFLRPEPGGHTCPSCQANNARLASFCVQCQNPLAPGVIPLQKPSATLDTVVVAAAPPVATAPPQAAPEFDLGEEAAEFVEEGAPPPPPAEVFDLGPPPPAPAVEVTGLEAPPPPLPGVETLDLEEALGEPQPATAQPPAPPEPSAPPPPPDTVQLGGDEVADEDFGGWSLDYDDQQQ